jgi:hypothetical protein
MGDFKKAMKNFMPMPPMPDGAAWEWPGKKDFDKDKAKEKWKEFKSNLGTFWGQLQDMQKSSMEASKEQWNTFFGQCMDMQESFAASLSEDVPFLPGMPLKAFVEKMKDFQEMANEHAIEQADSFFDFAMQGQQQFKAMVTETVANVETKVEEAKNEADAANAEVVDAKEVSE